MEESKYVWMSGYESVAGRSVDNALGSFVLVVEVSVDAIEICLSLKVWVSMGYPPF